MNTRSATRIKICGITRMVDAAAVAEAGADALGLNFSDSSARKVALPEARTIARAVSGTLCRVAVFVDQDATTVQSIMDAVDLDLLQFHGAETDAFCSSFGLPYMKAHRIRGPLSATELKTDYPAASLHLLDAFVPGEPGGTGQQFDWQFWPDAKDLKLVLAGGLNADNVGAAVTRLRPHGVDLAGGVEGSRKGEKDAQKIRALVSAVRQADAGPAH